MEAHTPEIQGRSFTDGHFEAFWYPSDDALDNSGDDIESEVYNDSCPCPAHTDPGIITLVAETVTALEARSTGGGPWHRLHLSAHEVAIVTGQQLGFVTGGKVPPCMHRVALTPAKRASYVFELYLQPTKEEIAKEAAEEAAACEASKAEATMVPASARRTGEVGSVSMLMHRATSRLVNPRRSLCANTEHHAQRQRCTVS